MNHEGTNIERNRPAIDRSVMIALGLLFAAELAPPPVASAKFNSGERLKFATPVKRLTKAERRKR